MRKRLFTGGHSPWHSSRLLVWLPLAIALVAACGGGNGNGY